MENSGNNKKLIHDFSGNDQNSFSMPRFFLLLFAVILAGSAVGFLLSKTTKSNTKGNSNSKNAKVEKTAGIADKKTFKDKAEGKLKEGGIDGEGNFYPERSGGESQNVYLTSTTVDLSQYIGKKIRVWGETFQAEKAGWLMDVGLVEVLQ